MVIAYRAILDDRDCGHNHRSERAATLCGTKLARSLEAPPPERAGRHGRD